MENEFYLRSRHGDTGCNVMFHNKNGYGYGTNLDNLHVFTKEEAQSDVNHDPANLPLLKSEVDKLAIRAVDMQHLDASKDLIDTLETKPATYVLQISGHWNGNDIYFNLGRTMTYDFDKADKYNFIDAFKIQNNNQGMVMWTVAYLETIARRTFQSHNINTRKMITGAGIKYKKPRKPRETTGKSRHNCGTCGKIVWEYNPYEPAYCDEWCQP